MEETLAIFIFSEGYQPGILAEKNITSLFRGLLFPAGKNVSQSEKQQLFLFCLKDIHQGF